MDAPGRLNHQLIRRITRGCIFIKDVINKKFNHASRRQLVNAFDSYGRNRVSKYTGRTVNGDMVDVLFTKLLPWP